MPRVCTLTATAVLKLQYCHGGKGETEAQRGNISGPRSHCWDMTKSKPRLTPHRQVRTCRCLLKTSPCHQVALPSLQVTEDALAAGQQLSVSCCPSGRGRPHPVQTLQVTAAFLGSPVTRARAADGSGKTGLADGARERRVALPWTWPLSWKLGHEEAQRHWQLILPCLPLCPHRLGGSLCPAMSACVCFLRWARLLPTPGAHSRTFLPPYTWLALTQPSEPSSALPLLIQRTLTGLWSLLSAALGFPLSAHRCGHVATASAQL